MIGIWKKHALQTRAFNEAHTGQNLSAFLRDVCREWKLSDNKPALVTDNARNMLLDGASAETETHIRCIAHTLNLSSQKPLKVETVSALLVKIRKLVKKFSQKPQSLWGSAWGASPVGTKTPQAGSWCLREVEQFLGHNGSFVGATGCCDHKEDVVKGSRREPAQPHWREHYPDARGHQAAHTPENSNQVSQWRKKPHYFHHCSNTGKTTGAFWPWW